MDEITEDGDDLEVIKSNKGGLKIIHKGYMYTVHKKRQCGGIRWRCAQRSLHCKGSISTGKNGPAKINMPHNHLPDLHSVAIARGRAAEDMPPPCCPSAPNLGGPLQQGEKDVDSMPLQDRLLKVSTSQEKSSPQPQSSNSGLKSHSLSPTKLKVTRQSLRNVANPAATPRQEQPQQVPPPPPPPVNEEMCLRWNSHHSNMQTSFPGILVKEQYVDVTLAAEGKTLKCHRLILSSCSPYFEEILNGISPMQHPVLFMKDIPFWILKSLCDFMYAGEVHIFQNKLEELLTVAEALKIKGLAGKSSPPEKHEDLPQNIVKPDNNKDESKEREKDKEPKEKKKPQQQQQHQQLLLQQQLQKPQQPQQQQKQQQRQPSPQAHPVAHKNPPAHAAHNSFETSFPDFDDNDDVLDPLDLLEPLYEEVQNEKKPAPPLVKPKENKYYQPVKKAFQRKLRKRKLSEVARDPMQIKTRQQHQTLQQQRQPSPQPPPVTHAHKSPPAPSAHNSFETSFPDFHDNDDMLDPLDLLEPVYEEVQSEKRPAPPVVKPKENKYYQPVKKPFQRKLRKRKLSEVARDPSPPLVFHFRKGTRSRPNVKIPKFYHSDYNKKDNKNTVTPPTSLQTGNQSSDPLLEVDEIKMEPIDVEDNMIAYNEEDNNLDNSVQYEIENRPLQVEPMDVAEQPGRFKRIRLRKPVISDVHSIEDEAAKDHLKSDSLEVTPLKADESSNQQNITDQFNKPPESVATQMDSNELDDKREETPLLMRITETKTVVEEGVSTGEQAIETNNQKQRIPARGRRGRRKKIRIEVIKDTGNESVKDPLQAIAATPVVEEMPVDSAPQDQMQQDPEGLTLHESDSAPQESVLQESDSATQESALQESDTATQESAPEEADCFIGGVPPEADCLVGGVAQELLEALPEEHLLEEGIQEDLEVNPIAELPHVSPVPAETERTPPNLEEEATTATEEAIPIVEPLLQPMETEEDILLQDAPEDKEFNEEPEESLIDLPENQDSLYPNVRCSEELTNEEVLTASLDRLEKEAMNVANAITMESKLNSPGEQQNVD